jgi:hypothetical protein
MVCGKVRSQPSHWLIPNNLKIAQVGRDVDDSLRKLQGKQVSPSGCPGERLRREMEARVGIEPAYTALQAAA